MNLFHPHALKLKIEVDWIMHWLDGYNWTEISLNTAGTHKLGLFWIMCICRYVHTHKLTEKHLVYSKKKLRHKEFCLVCGTVQADFLKIVFQCHQNIISTWSFSDNFQQQTETVGPAKRQQPLKIHVLLVQNLIVLYCNYVFMLLYL